MGSILTRKEWQKLRNGYKFKKGLIRSSVGKSLDNYHDAETTEAKLKMLSAVESNLREYMKALQKDGAQKPENKGFIKAIGAILVKIKARTKKLQVYKKLEKETHTLTLAQILASKKLSRAFREFCTKAYCVENLDYLESERRGNEYLYDTFVRTDTANFGEGSGPIIKEMAQAAAQGNWKAKIWEQGKQEIEKNLSYDVLPRFIKSDLLKNLIEKISGAKLAD